jgi:hypothetical protein
MVAGDERAGACEAHGGRGLKAYGEAGAAYDCGMVCGLRWSLNSALLQMKEALDLMLGSVRRGGSEVSSGNWDVGDDGGAADWRRQQ